MTNLSAPNPLALGTRVEIDGEEFVISRYLDLQTVVGIRQTDGERVRLAVSAVLAAAATAPIKNSASDATASPAVAEEELAGGSETLSDEDWEVAQKTFAIMLPILEADGPSKEFVRDIARQLGKDISTIYRWKKQYRETGQISVFAPFHPSGGRGKSRLDPLVEAIVDECVRDEYLSQQRFRISDLMMSITSRCRRAGLAVPHPNSVRRRCEEIPDRIKTERREGRHAARKFVAAPGKFPGGSHPNEVWQIDHTPLDVCIVDDTSRLNIGRPWLTLAIDVFSRCVVGFYLSMDTPSTVSVGMALVHAILPKDGWLAARGFDVSWPMRGRPVIVHADNDKTFRTKLLNRTVTDYRFQMNWRPVKTPHWGGHIERLLGTLNFNFHTIPGTTFSNPRQRGDYKPHKEAVMTFREVEAHLVDLICGVYHQRKHSELNRPPTKQYEDGLLGNGTHVGIGLPPPEPDPERLRLDFLPFIERTVQRAGVQLDKIHYYDSVLDRWIHAKSPSNKKKKRLFLVRRDPRDISHVWFLDPDLNRYFKLPYRNIEHPAISSWDLNAVRKHLADQGAAEVDEELIFRTWERMQERIRQAAQLTQQTRKLEQKRKINSDKKVAEIRQVNDATAELNKSPVEAVALSPWDDDEPVEPFSAADR